MADALVLAARTARSSLGTSGYVQLKIDLHRQLLDRIDLDVMGRLGAEKLREELRILVERLLVEQGAALNAGERKQIVADIENEVLGLGPLESLLRDAPSEVHVPCEPADALDAAVGALG